jgi:predicted PurR-regulated permease PerM
MDNLEKFILERRSEFDTGVPDLKVWSGVVRGLEKRPLRRIVIMKRLRIAAAVALLLTAGGLIGAYLASHGQEVKSLADLSPEYAEMERYYNNQINQKLAQLASYRQDGYVRADLQELDTIYEELKQDLQNVPSGSEEQVIQAMINNYQTKVSILERVLEKVQTTNQTNLKTVGNEVSL